MKYKSLIARWAYDIISLFFNQIIVVYYIKRTTGEMRRMACVYNPGVDQQPEDLRYNREKKNLLLVWDVEKADWRQISMDAVQKIVVGRNEFTWREFSQASRDMEMCDRYDDMMADSEIPFVLNLYSN